MSRILSVFLILFLAGSKLSGQDTRELLPSLQELPGWQLSQEPLVFDGDRLFELINGGADIYLEYGFTQVVSAQYTDPSKNTIIAEIYEMTDDAAAYGIFSVTQQSVDWTMEFGNLSAVTGDYLSFWKNKYYVSISWSSRQETDRSEAALLADLISGNIHDNGVAPQLINEFFKPGARINVIYFRGNLGLSNFYYFDYKDVFRIKEGLAVPKDSYHEIIFRYDNSEKSIETLESARQSIALNKRFSEMINEEHGFSCRDNKGNYILVHQVNSFIVMLVGLKADISLSPFMENISEEIERNFE